MYQEPVVNLLHITPEAERLIVHATRTCYDSHDRSCPEGDQNLIRRCIEQGHESVIEHANATFEVWCSRVASHELVRHRMASYSQRSQRFVQEDDDGSTSFRQK